jgi:hypothetical protein
MVVYRSPNSFLHVILLTKAYHVSLDDPHLPLVPFGNPQWWKPSL